MDLPSQLQELLPNGYSYRLKKWISYENEPPKFESVILTNIYTEAEAQKWWHEFNVKSNTTMRVRATCPKTGKVNLFKIYLRCLHQGRAENVEKNAYLQKSKYARNTNCPAGMIVAIRRVIKYSRSKKRDPVDPVHPCEIQIHFIHNHPTKSADSLRFRPVSKEAEDKIISLYQAGHSPSSALETLKIDLQIEHSSSFSDIVSDRYHCPDKSFCYRLYYKHFGKDYASSAKKDILDLLTSKVSYYNNILGETCLTVGLSGAEYAIAACTPLMKRSHSLIQSGDIVYVELYESPINRDRYEHHILLLNVHTAVGGIPLGAVLATSNSTDVLTLAFQLLKQLLPDQAFYGRGVSGPHAFLIEDSDNQKSALNDVWPDSDVIICSFRILQTMWRWLWDEKHSILKDHRLYLLYLLKTILFAASDSDMTAKYQDLCSDNIAVHYPLYLHQVESLWKRRHLWGICFHRLLPLQDANNYFEAAVRTLKDKTFEQTRAFNIIQLLNFIVTRIDFFYKTKISNILQEKTKYIFLSYFPDSIPPHIVNDIKQIAGDYYIVPSESEEDKIYTIDVELNSCSCHYGLNGSMCIHQYWIFLKTPSDMFKADISDVNFKQKLLIIASGPSTPDSKNISTLSNTTEDLNNIDSNCKNISMNSSHSILESLVSETTTASNVPGSEVGLAGMLRNNETFLSHAKSCSPESANSQVDTTPISTPTLLNSSQNVPCVTLVPTNPVHDTTNVAVNLETPSDLDSGNCSQRKGFGPSKDADKTSELNLRKVKALKDFENFCKKVKDGLDNQTDEFLPALEIMMKNLERNGDTNKQIISGMSFFGIVSVPSLMNKGKKRPASKFTCEEIFPKVHGRQMITYGRKKSTNEVKSIPQPQNPPVTVTKLSENQLKESSVSDR